jgi:hypothetical protein
MSRGTPRHFIIDRSRFTRIGQAIHQSTIGNGKSANVRVPVPRRPRPIPGQISVCQDLSWIPRNNPLSVSALPPLRPAIDLLEVEQGSLYPALHRLEDLVEEREAVLETFRKMRLLTHDGGLSCNSEASTRYRLGTSSRLRRNASGDRLQSWDPASRLIRLHSHLGRV